MGEIQRRDKTRQLFSYHVIEAPFLNVAALLSSRALRSVPGLHHAECLLHMKMGLGWEGPWKPRFATTRD